MTDPVNQNPFLTLPTALIGLTLGWAFTLFQQNRSNVRAEAIRRKDKIIDKVDKIVDWIEKQAADGKVTEHHLEAGYSALISQVEIRIVQLNSLVKCEIVDMEYLMRLRAIDTSRDRSELPHAVREAASDLIEQLELSCSRLYFEKKTLLVRLHKWAKGLNTVKHEFSGIAAGAWALAGLSAFGVALSKLI